MDPFLLEIVRSLKLDVDLAQTGELMKQEFERVEVRYRARSDWEPSAVPEGATWSDYSVCTIYVGYYQGARIRLRSYDGDNFWWIEQKRRVRQGVAKSRWALGSLDFQKLKGYSVVRYRRRALDTPYGRLTIDTDVVANDGRCLRGAVVETKGTISVGNLPSRADRFSKFRFVTGRLNDNVEDGI